MSNEEHTITFNLDVDISKTVTALSEMNSLVTTYIALVRRSGLPPDIVRAVAELERLRISIMALHRAFLMLEATTPIGLALALGSIAVAGLMYGDITSELHSR